MRARRGVRGGLRISQISLKFALCRVSLRLVRANRLAKCELWGMPSPLGWRFADCASNGTAIVIANRFTLPIPHGFIESHFDPCSW